MLAARYANMPQVFGADLFNEPKRTTRWEEWNAAATLAANAIHAVNPDILIVVEGVEKFYIVQVKGARVKGRERVK